MPLQFVEPTSAVRATYAEGLLDITGSPPPDDSAVHIPVWTLGMDAVVKRLGPDSLQPSGCRFYASYPLPLGTLASEMTNPHDYGKAKFRSLMSGERAEWGWALIQQLGALPEVVSADYELHLLSIPSLFVEAFYLRSVEQTTPSHVVPLDLFDDALAVPAAQEVAGYLDGLQLRAAARAAMEVDSLLP